MSFLDFLFPKICLGCGFLGSYFCLDCRHNLRLVEKDCCFYCRSFSLLGLTHPSCSKKLSIDGFLPFFYYNDLMKKIIKNIKYQLVREAFNDLFDTIAPLVVNKLGSYKNLFANCFLQPVPLHPSRLSRRGFNQAQIIADFFGKILKLPVVDFLKRKKSTFPLASLRGKKKRYLEIRGAFAVKDMVKIVNKEIILVDDVVTTGSTVKEAARVLKKAGAAKVYVFSLAKG